MRTRKSKRRINGKLIEAKEYSGFFRLPWEVKERNIALKTTDKQVADKRLSEYVKVLQRQHEGLDVPSYLWGAPKRDLPALLSEYLDSLKAKERGAKHIRGVRVHIERLIKDCKWTTTECISPRSFESWRSAGPVSLRTNKPLSPKSKNEYLGDITAFLNWLRSCEIIERNPLEFVKAVEVRGKETKRRALWTLDTLHAFLATCPGGRTDYRSAVLLLFKTGVRKSTLQNLRWGDIHLEVEQPYIAIRADNEKTKTSRPCFIDTETANLIRGLRPEHARPEENVLGYKIPNSTRLKKDLEALGIQYRTVEGDLDFHALRHTCATMFTTDGNSTAVVQSLLGHKTRDMAERYTIQSAVKVDAALSNRKPIFGDENYTDICTDFADFSGHPVSQADTQQSAPQIASIPLPVTPRHKEAPSVRKRLNSENGGESRIRTSELKENRFTVCVL